MSDMDDGVAIYMNEVERACANDERLSPLAGGILAGIALDIAHDSRGFAKIFGIEHALVLREVQALVGIERLIVTKRDARTQRCSYAPAPGSSRRRFAGDDHG